MWNLDFAWPYAALAWLLLIPLWRYGGKRGEGLLFSPQLYAIQQISPKSATTFSKKINWWLVVAWSLLVIALMRPHYVGEPLEISQHGRNIMLVLDISESMEALDMNISGQPVDRLSAAKNVMKDFIAHRRGDRVGLVVFGSESFLHAPLSFDHPTIVQFLMDAQIGFAGPKTAIGDAIGLAAKKLIDQSEGDKTMVLLTDGQNNMGALEPLQAASIAKKYGVRIYVVGLGSSRMVVDGFFGPTAVNPSVSLDEAEPELKEIAAMTSGKYFRARDFAALAEIYKDIDALEPVKADPLLIIPKKELFFWPLTLFLVLLFFRFVWLLWSGPVKSANLSAVNEKR